MSIHAFQSYEGVNQIYKFDALETKLDFKLKRSKVMIGPSDYLEVYREYCQNCSVLDCVTQCSQSAVHLCEQFLQVKQIGFVTLRPLRCA